QSTILAMGLISYIPGAIILGYLSDLIGRRNMLIYTIILIAIGSVGMALSVDYNTLLFFRIIEGAGIGGDLVITAVYIVEYAPALKRGIYMNWIYIAGWIAVGGGAAFTGILVQSLPTIGWRIAFGIAAALAIAAIVLRISAPESIRFLVKNGRMLEAERLTRHMEEIVISKLSVPKLPEYKSLSYEHDHRNPFRIVIKRFYLKRFIGLLIFWFTIYMVQYTFSGFWGGYLQLLGITGDLFNRVSILTAYSAVGATMMAFLMLLFIDKVDRRLLIQIGSLGWLIGVSLSAVAVVQQNWALMFLLQLLVSNFLGGGLSYLAGYLISAESFPTSARATGFALTDGLGHLGGGVGALLIVPLIKSLGSILPWVIISFPVVIGAGLLWVLLPRTVGYRLEEINEVMEREVMLKSKIR
ncbi:MAG: MFS transporter, partial [Sulfolobaceae archaeon]